jgi:uncharacterized membrane protein YsdA (DUF1294 family)
MPKKQKYYKYNSPYKSYGIIIAIVAILIFSIGFYFELNFWLIYFLTINLLTFIFYFYDKVISSSKMMRLPEIIFHWLTFLGGSPSAFLAQKVFHHKTRKTSFQIIFWLIVLVQIVLVIFVYNWLDF